MTIIFLSHDDKNLFLFRLPIMQDLQKKGHQVIALAPYGKYFPLLLSHGIRPISYPIDRKSLNPFKELQTLLALAKIFKQERPNIIHTFMFKPNIYGAFASLWLKNCYLINHLSGLGSLYTKPTLKTIIIRYLIECLSKQAFKRAKKVIFHTQADLHLYLQKKLLPASKAILIKGSGINTSAFYPLSKNQQTQLRAKLGLAQQACIVLMVARAIAHKGVYEYFQAAKRLSSYPMICFLYVGGVDKNNPSSLSEEFFKQHSCVQYLGERQDIKELVGLCDIFVLPSYREGISHSMLEAASMQKPIITSCAIGCKEVVEDGLNGFVVPLYDSQMLAKKILQLANNPSLAKRFGKNGRQKILKEFSLDVILPSYHKLYNQAI